VFLKAITEQGPRINSRFRKVFREVCFSMNFRSGKNQPKIRDLGSEGRQSALRVHMSAGRAGVLNGLVSAEVGVGSDTPQPPRTGAADLKGSALRDWPKHAGEQA
jgi:hypothetical protein